MAFQQAPPHAPEPPRKLDVHLEAVAAFQAGAAMLQAGTALALREEDGRVTAVTQDGTAVGLIPADKWQLLSRGPWAGTVRSVKRQPASSQATDAATAASSQQQAAAAAQLPEQQPEQQQQQQPASDAAGEEQQAAAVPPAEQAQRPSQPPAAVVVQVLVRFTPEEQRWAQRQAAGQLAQPVEEDTARLSTEQFEALGEHDGGQNVLLLAHCPVKPACWAALLCACAASVVASNLGRHLPAVLACLPPSQLPTRSCGGCCEMSGCKRW